MKSISSSRLSALEQNEILYRIAAYDAFVGHSKGPLDTSWEIYHGLMKK